MQVEPRLASLLREHAVRAQGADYDAIALANCRDIAAELGISRRSVELAALAMGICPARYERSIGTLGMAGQKKLLESRVAVVGLGGLGGLIVELAARAGVGSLVLIDGDVYAENNLNRQLLCTERDIGRSKADAAAARAAEINAAVEVASRHAYLDETNAAQYLHGVDVVVDALDNNRARTAVIRACREAGVPFVHGAIGGWWAQVGLFRPSDRTPWEISPDVPDRGVELVTGNPPFTPAFAASLEVALMTRYLTEGDDCESGALHWFDLRDLSTQRVRL